MLTNIVHWRPLNLSHVYDPIQYISVSEVVRFNFIRDEVNSQRILPYMQVVKRSIMNTLNAIKYVWCDWTKAWSWQNFNFTQRQIINPWQNSKRTELEVSTWLVLPQICDWGLHPLPSMIIVPNYRAIVHKVVSICPLPHTDDLRNKG